MAPKFPAVILLLYRLRYGHSAEYVLGDLMEEYHSGSRSSWWLWRQTLSLLSTRSGRPAAGSAPRRNHMNWIHSSWNDFCYAARTLRHNPGFAIVAVIAIALGIGVNTGIFTVLNGVALRPLPVPSATHVVSVYQDYRGLRERNVHGSSSFFSWNEYLRYRDDNHVFSGLLAYSTDLIVTLAGDHPQQLFGQLASCNYFDVLDAPPALGRSLVSSDCAAQGQGSVIVLSDDLWRSRFAADPAVIGRTVILNRVSFVVVGVAPRGFRGTEPIPAAYWAPLTMQPKLEREFNCFASETSWLVLLGRTKPGVSMTQVRADLGVIAGRIDQLTPGRRTTLQIETGTLLGLPEAHKIITAVGAVILAAVGMVLLIACANVANLLLARAAGRQKEIAIRLSVGASRGRLIRQLLTESVLIALLGGVLGSAVALWSFNAIVAYVLTHLPHGAPPLTLQVTPDLRVLFYSIALTLGTGIIFGLAPALQASRPDVNAALKDSSAGGGSMARSGGFLRSTLVGAQVAVSMILLISAGLLLHGLYVAQTIDPGFAMSDVTSASFDLRGQGYDPRRAALFQQQAMERIRALPGIQYVAQAWTSPLSDSHRGTDFILPGQSRGELTELNYVSTEYLPMLEIPVVRGRPFREDEVRAGARVAMVTETTARRFWPNENAIGKTFRMDKSEYQVIGIVKDAQVSHIARSDETYMYLPAGPDEQVRLQLLVRGPGADPRVIQSAIHDLDPNLVVDAARLEENLEFWRAPSRIAATLAGSLGALGLLLASIGVYGVVSYAVSRRFREIGIRMTLGADAREVRSLILKQAMRPVLIGAAIGVAGCAAVSAVLKSMLFGISAYDPVAFVIVPLVLLSVALLASYIPARRATQVDPMVALRYE